MDATEIRQRFLDYFEAHGHKVVASAPLVPGNDPTLLFTNAGMVQFKDVFLGLDKCSYTRATTSQRCLRAGGKHNDLENVGYTSRHHTFFEMLGNFSFGDYFKKEAIHFAWEFLTKELQLPPEKLWVTVYQDDEDAADIWLKDMGVDPERFSRLGEKDNFWSMGDTGPCGPCSEIFYDHGADVPGGPPGSADEDGDRYVEIWNLVFMQFDRTKDGTLVDLPKPSVDTGMGLERMAAVMQNVRSNYDIHVFQALIKKAAILTGAKDLAHPSLKVIADHIRACSFLIVDGVLPGNEGRGYVLRRIIRRALRHGHELGTKKAFFHKLIPALVGEMGDAYPELLEHDHHVEKILLEEEKRFDETLSQGMTILEQALAELDGKQLPGDVAFTLYDTYGFPLDLTIDILRGRGIAVDAVGFDVAMEAQRHRSRSSARFAVEAGELKIDAETHFTGYETLDDAGRVLLLFRDGKLVDTLNEGEAGQVVLVRTPFYAESGGQVGDAGTLNSRDSTFSVEDTQRSGNAYLHIGRITKGSISVDDMLAAVVDKDSRLATELNHSATHLLHAALRQVLGKHVAQKGSLVGPDKLRFDFSHNQAVSAEELLEIEDLVNAQIRHNESADTRLMAYDDAVASGAVALFGEKYGDEVRVLQIGDFSVELCGGTHVQRAGDIGLFRIASETGIASGVRRIEAITGEQALSSVRWYESVLDSIGGVLKASRTEVKAKVGQLVDNNKALEKELKSLRSKIAGAAGQGLADAVQEINGIQVLAARMDDDTDAGSLRDTVDRMKDKLGTAVVVLGAATADGKVRLAAGVSKNITDRVKAGDLIREVAGQVGGKGGGRPDFAQAGGDNPAALDKALAGVGAWIESRSS
ncbi:MAG: alanine--tRNA ligase [Gammaproteobacteria bacterium]|nr:alanine--tRNA ligase [Gammaproteobacteria bacterium]MCP4088241.1 alanine--tRNA ligase [Gammaproteobacteria bacterium]MCP4831095.1 alanine--tRNA ligase [Gammaproteobacteria bacterium]MCP4929363.1 alanine--tRNA ligase [Gammaproteobacteria bacterium]